MGRFHHDEAGLAVLLSSEGWRRRIALWGGALAVALAAIVFAKAADAAFGLFQRALAFSPYAALIVTPIVLGGCAWATSRGLQATRGSGIPQVIASLDLPDDRRVEHVSLRVSIAKLVLTTLGLAGGASIGREGPSVHLGAGIMYAVGRAMGFRDPEQGARFLLAGGAAGIAAAFNTPLAGVVFAIEELSGTFEHRFSGTLLTAVLVGGVVSLGLLGSYTYFGHVSTSLPLGQGWLAVVLCGVVCGLAGGGFSRLLLAAVDGRPRALGALRARHPVLLAVLCGLVLALLGLAFGNGMFGTGYAQARELLQGGGIDRTFGPAKLVANLVSYVAGIPGGLFSPALAVGAGLGHDLSLLLPGVSPTAVVLLGMCAYLTGVTQAPLTSAVICMELTDNRLMLLPILGTVLIARAASSLVCHVPVYKALAHRLVASMAPAAPAEPA
ncbi:chloride channel protein [Lysobacter sp. HA18]